MKIQIDLSQIQTTEVKDKIITFRIPFDEFRALKRYNSNVSQTLRGLVTQLLSELEKDRTRWTRKK